MNHFSSKLVSIWLFMVTFVVVLVGDVSAADRPISPPHNTPTLPPDAIGIPIPQTGQQKLLVILADFPDRAGLFTGEAWQDLLFDTGSGSFADYFREVSYDQLLYSGDIVGMNGATPVVNSPSIAYVRLPNPITYYADGSFGFDVSTGQFPQNNGGVVRDALQTLDTAGFDFAPYANPDTNEVENLLVVFAGSSYGYVQDPWNSLEATAYRLDWAGLSGGYVASGGQHFHNYTFCPDQRWNLSGLLAYIGICAHEHGHALGVPDLYDYSYTTTGVGYYGIMGYGTFGASAGLEPFHFSTFSKEFVGWSQFEPVNNQATSMNFTLHPAETNNDFIKLYPNGNSNSEEYFLLENRQPLGFDQDWTGVGLCPGLFIWHIDQDIVDTYFAMNSLPSAGGGPHQGAIVVEADGGFDMITPPLNYGDCDDRWAVGRTWDASSTPDSDLWDGSASGLSVTVVAQNADGSVDLSITAPPNAIYRTMTVPTAVVGVRGMVSAETTSILSLILILISCIITTKLLLLRKESGETVQSRTLC